jgi:hypothetical protein
MNDLIDNNNIGDVSNDSIKEFDLTPKTFKRYLHKTQKEKNI